MKAATPSKKKLSSQARSVYVNGKKFPTIAAAAKFLHVDHATIRNHINAGTACKGATLAWASKPWKAALRADLQKQTEHRSTKPQPIYVDGRKFKSIHTAAKVYNVSRKIIANRANSDTDHYHNGHRFSWLSGMERAASEIKTALKGDALKAKLAKARAPFVLRTVLRTSAKQRTLTGETRSAEALPRP